MSLGCIYYPSSYEQNSFESYVRSQAWASHFQVFHEPFFVKHCKDVIRHIWTESRSAIIFEEVNTILLSLALILGFRIHSFVRHAIDNITSIWLLRLAKSLARCFLWIWNNTIDILVQFWKQNPFQSIPNRVSPPVLRGRRHMVYTSIYNIDKIVAQLDRDKVSFDPDSTFVICDNAANTHICNDRKMFTDFRELKEAKVVATIGGKNSKPSGVGTVRWIWHDDSGKKHHYCLPNVFYFPGSPVNILSITTFAK